jgi:hypothetical protein
VWKQGPTVVNAKILELVEAHTETKVPRKKIAEETSPETEIRDGKLNAKANEKQDKGDGSEELSTLPFRQRAIIRVLLSSIENDSNISPSLITALKEYDSELVARGTRPMLGLLNDMAHIVTGEFNTLIKEKFFKGQGGLKKSFDGFSDNHKLIQTHFPLDAERETKLRMLRIDWSRIDLSVLRSLATDFIKSVDEVAKAGYATLDFERVSFRIADTFRSAMEKPPLSAFQRDPDAPFELNWQDRALVKMMSYGDNLIQTERTTGAPQTLKETVHDAGLIVTASQLVELIALAIVNLV